MVKEIKKKGEVYFQCEECGFAYKEKPQAEKCTAWCAQHNSCNINVIKHAVK